MQGEQGNSNNNNEGAHRASESTVQTVVSQLQNQIYQDIEVAQHARVVRRSPARGDKPNLDLDLARRILMIYNNEYQNIETNYLTLNKALGCEFVCSLTSD